MKRSRFGAAVAAALTSLAMMPIIGLATQGTACAATNNCQGYPVDNEGWCTASYTTVRTHLFTSLPDGTPVRYKLRGAPGGRGGLEAGGAGGPGAELTGTLIADRTSNWVVRVGGTGGAADGGAGGPGGANGGADGASGNQGGGGGGTTGIYLVETLQERGTPLALAAGGGGGGGGGNKSLGGAGGNPAAGNGSAGGAGEDAGSCRGGSGGPAGPLATLGGGGGGSFDPDDPDPDGAGGGGGGGGGAGAGGCGHGGAAAGASFSGGRGGDGQACIPESGGRSFAVSLRMPPAVAVAGAAEAATAHPNRLITAASAEVAARAAAWETPSAAHLLVPRRCCSGAWPMRRPPRCPAPRRRRASDHR